MTPHCEALLCNRTKTLLCHRSSLLHLHVTSNPAPGTGPRLWRSSSCHSYAGENCVWNWFPKTRSHMTLVTSDLCHSLPTPLRPRLRTYSAPGVAADLVSILLRTLGHLDSTSQLSWTSSPEEMALQPWPHGGWRRLLNATDPQNHPRGLGPGSLVPGEEVCDSMDLCV